MGSVGVVAVTWALFPPAAGRLSHPPAQGCSRFWGTPRLRRAGPCDPRQRGRIPLWTPPGFGASAARGQDQCKLSSGRARSPDPTCLLRQRGQAPSAKGGQVWTPPRMCRGILSMTIRLPLRPPHRWRQSRVTGRSPALVVIQAGEVEEVSFLDVHEAPVGELQGGDDGERQEREDGEGLVQGGAEGTGGGVDGDKPLGN